MNYELVRERKKINKNCSFDSFVCFWRILMSKFLLFLCRIVDSIVCRCNWMRDSINTCMHTNYVFLQYNNKFYVCQKTFLLLLYILNKTHLLFWYTFCRSRRCCLLSHFLLLSCILKYVPYIQIIFNLMLFQDYFKGYAIK